MGSSWDFFVDAVIIVWLAVFIIGELYSEYSSWCDLVNIVLLPVFIADLIVRYRRVGSLVPFLKRHWIDILMVIPYMRFLRILRLLRLVRIVRISRTAKLIIRYGKFVKKSSD